MNRKFELLLIKNTLAIAIPALAVFAVLLAFLLRYPIFDKIDCKVIQNSSADNFNLEDKLKALYEDGTYNVSLEVKELYYSGFDYYVDNVKKGAYYYTVSKDKLNLYLLDRTDGMETIESIKLKGRIIKDKASVNHIFNMLSSANGITYFEDTDFYTDYIISEPDYPDRFVKIVYLFYSIPMIICLLILLYTIVVWTNPRFNPQAKKLSAYGKISTIIRHLDKQLSDCCIYQKDNIYLTDDYLVVSSFTTTDVIKFDAVIYTSKNLIENEGFLGEKKKIFRITFSSPEVLFYEVDFTDESFCDLVLEHIDSMV